jgi:hypothetical protein
MYISVMMNGLTWNYATLLGWRESRGDFFVGVKEFARYSGVEGWVRRRDDRQMESAFLIQLVGMYGTLSIVYCDDTFICAGYLISQRLGRIHLHNHTHTQEKH